MLEEKPDAQEKPESAEQSSLTDKEMQNGIISKFIEVVSMIFKTIKNILVLTT